MYLCSVKPLKLIRLLAQALARPQVSWLIFIAVVLHPASVQSQPVINEVMADNLTTIANGGLFSDWIELYNPGASDVSLNGYGLSDSTNTPLKFAFPASAVLPANSRLLVWCDAATNAPGYHATAFSLAAKGELVALHFRTTTTTSLVDLVTFGPQLTDRSIGRIPDGTGTWTLNQPTPDAPNLAQALGPITGLRINEWTATNTIANSEGTNDWLELYNPSTNPVALAGLVFSTDLTMPPANTARPPLSFIEAGGFLLYHCVGNKSAKNADELDFKLSNTTGETNTLYASDRTNIIDRITFPGNVAVPGYWAADISYGRLPDGGTNIVRFSPSKVTPEASNFLPITNVVINECLTHTDPPIEDAIELYNPTTSDVDISYWWLSNRAENANKFQIPPGTVLPALGYKVFYEQAGNLQVPHQGSNTSGTGSDPDFTLNSAHGDSVYLFTGDVAGTLTGFRKFVTFGSAEHGFSFGRYITTAGVDFTAMSHTTFGHDNPTTLADFRMGTGLTNAYPKMGPLVINEIMYHPPDIIMGATVIDDATNEYIEVYNITTNTVYLYDPTGLVNDETNFFWAHTRTNTWKLGGMVNFDFPTNIHLAAGESLLLVNFDPAIAPELNAFRTKYGIPSNVQIFGPYGGGKLKNSGGAVELYKPDPPQPPSHPDWRYVPFILVDRINFNDKAPWPTGADGGGSALQRIVPERYGNEPTNWVAAAPTPGWQTVHIDSSQQVGNSFVLGFSGWAGGSYSIQWKTDLALLGGWTRLTNFNPWPTSGWHQVTTPLTTSNRFYRLVTPAQ